MKEIYKLVKEEFIFWLMFLLFFMIWLISTIIFYSFCITNGIKIDATLIGSYANILVFNATIFAPIAAYFFYDMWKKQNKLVQLANIANDTLDVCYELRSSIFDIRIAHNNSFFGIFRITMIFKPFKEELLYPDKYIRKILQKTRVIEEISGNKNLTVIVRDIINLKLEIENHLNNIFVKKWNYKNNDDHVKNKVSEISRKIKKLEDELYKYIRYEQPS